MNDLKILMAIVIITLSTEALFSQENRSNEIEFETDATSLQSLNGLIASQRFGASVANCGDVNGDGYDDIISGAHLTNSNTGKAYIYFGGVIMSSTPAIVLNGEGANNYFGLSVSSAGDVNGDGYNDVIVGAYGYSSNTGRAYIYYGGYNMDNVADIVITGPGAFSFGYTVSSAGDVNGDGFSDVIISGHAYSSNKGRAYICYGGLIMDNTPDKILEGAVTGGFFGFALSGAGDVNGDGYSDVIIGAYAVSSFTGAAYLYYGGASMDTISDVIFSGEASNSFLGQSVTGAGDVNGDGYSDLLIGASLYSASTGRAYLYYGSGTMDNTADVTFTGEGMGNNFGRGLAGVGDVNGDGYSDIFIGAQSYSGSKGRAYLYYGGVSMNNISDMKLTGESGNNYFGFSLAGGGDINGDGYKDFLAGAYGVSSNKGKVYIYKNSMTGNDIPDVSSYGEMTSSNFGISVSDAGDVNGDGYGDYIAGAGSYGNFARGKAYIYFGSVNPDTIPDLKINGLEDFSWFGLTVSGIGDINADGYDDIAVGAPEYDNGRGRVYIYYGGSVMDTVHDASITGTSISSLNKFGQSISSGGDMNGDGFSDIIIGSPGYLNSRGLAQIFFGGSPLDTIPDYSVTSGSMNEFAGTSVACAGDINSDGYSDVLIGVPGYSVTGKVYVVFGGNSFSLRSFEGQTGDEYLGYSVSGAGDVNGDGYSDFVVGAPYGNNSRGKSYLYHGGVNYDFIPDVEFSTGSESEFGVSVSGAGDLNNDGYDDVLISELGFNFNSGRAFIYFGGYAMNNAPDILMNANYQGEEFGFCVSIAGDINGDGTDDVLIGAPLNEKYGVTGAAYLYLSSPPSVEPILISVKDVPNDQGGKVFLKWTRSAYDITGTDMITDYLIQRSLPPGSGGFFWENISNIPATRESYYGFTDNTPFDSLSGNSGTLYYRITARTNNQNNFWRSNIVFGRSIDNIAPLMVSPFTAAGVSGNVNLNWKRSDAPDLLNYVLYRSASPVIDPETEPVFAITADSLYTDTAPLSGEYYYFIVAQDIHNNKSPVAVAASPESYMTLNLTMFIEGFYTSGFDLQVSDTITVELRNSVSPYAVAGQSKAFVENDGTVQLTFPSAANGNYYISIKHRNSIETWSASPMAFSTSSPVNYDLSSSSSQAFGSNEKQVDASPLRFGIYSGDENQNGIVDLTDVVNVSNAASSFTIGYVPTDMNGDNITDLSDLVITSNNASAFVAKVTP